MATARLSVRDWDGPSGRTLIQGLRWAPWSKHFITAQADDVKGQAEQDSVFRVATEKMTYTGISCTAKEGGHASSFGIFNQAGKTQVLLGHAKLGLVRFPLVDGRAKPVELRIPFQGTATCNQRDDLLCMRSGTTYVVYSLSAVLARQPKQLARTVIPAFYDRFQGHHVFRMGGHIVIAVHGDDGTKKRSELRLHALTSSSKWRTLDTINTRGMGDEAEGCVDYGPSNADYVRLWVVKRTGGDNDNRTVDMTPTGHYPVPPKPKTSARGGWKVHGTGKGWMYAREVGVPESKWVKRYEGDFRVTTGDHWAYRNFPDVGHSELYLVTKAGRWYRAKYLQRA